MPGVVAAVYVALCACGVIVGILAGVGGLFRAK